MNTAPLLRKILFLPVLATAMAVLIFTSTPEAKTSAVISTPPGIWFGKKSSAVEVYFVSDWLCPFCRKIEPEIEKMAPAVGAVAKYTFLDLPVHRESSEFIPYSQSILVNEKLKYFTARKALIELATKTRNPDNQSVADAMKRHGISFKMIGFSTVMQLSVSGQDVIRKTKVTMTPTVVVRNSKTGKQQLLIGAQQIQSQIVLAAIKNLES